MSLEPRPAAPGPARRPSAAPRRSIAAILASGLAVLALAACGDAGTSSDDVEPAAADAAATASSPAAGDAPGGRAAANDGLIDVVRTTFHPTTYFAERIADGLVAVDSPLPAGDDPMFWSPTRNAIETFQRSRLIAVNGADYERWVPMVALPESRTVVTTRDFEEPFIVVEGVTHSHGPAGEHSHDGIDGHTWVDPVNAIRQARTLGEAMQRTWPEHAEAFAANLAALVADLEELDAAMRAIAPRLEGVVLLSNHPSYGYLARRYGLTITNVDLDPEALPGGADLANVRAAIPDEGDRQVILLWESEPLDEVRQLLFADMRVESLVFDPAESLTRVEQADGFDYLSIMRHNIEQLGSMLPPA